jgi:hypothetical protein
MAEDSLLWPTEKEVIEERVTGTTDPAAQSVVRGELTSATARGSSAIAKMFRQDLVSGAMDEEYARTIKRFTPTTSPGTSQNVLTPVSLSMDRHALWLEADRQAVLFHAWLVDEDAAWLADALGLVVTGAKLPKTISSRNGRPSVEIHSVRTVMKRGALGWPEKFLVVVVTQRRVGNFDKQKQATMDATPDAWKDPEPDFKYRAGCTLLIDPERTQIKRVVRTPGTVADERELDRMRAYLLRGLDPPNAFYSVGARLQPSAEPFAFLHSHLRA